MRLIDADALQIKIASLSRLARSDAQKSLMGRVLYIIDQMPTITMPQWVSVKDRLPEEQKEVLIYLPEYDSVEMASLFTIPSLNLKEWTQDEDAFMLDEVSHWMSMPEPPDKRYKCRYADDNGVCDKFTESEEIVYCTGRPCLYYTPVEVRDDGAHIKPELW